MPAFKLKPDPTFTARVPLPVPGASDAKVSFTFKYRNRDQFIELLPKLDPMEDLEMLQTICCGWDLPEPFDEEHIKEFILWHIGGPRAVLRVYLDENGQPPRLGNS